MTTVATETGLVKRATGLPGLDAVTHGGLPAAGATLVVGEPGAGKTILSEQLLAGAIARGDGGVLVSFEESPAQMRRDAASFAWGERLANGACALIDARPQAGAEAAGSFDLEGLTAAIGTQVDRGAGSWVVLDGIDRLLRLQPDADSAVDQVARLSDRCADRGVTVVLTGKGTERGGIQPAYLEGLEYMLDSVIVLSTEIVGGRLNRRFRIAKYRGTAHATDELPMVIDDAGVHLPYGADATAAGVAAPTARVGTGIPRLDSVLGGGLYRGSTTLISGAPGTAKTTLAASFASAAAGRGECVLYLSFDELADHIVRNLASVGIELQPHVDSGHLVIDARAAWRSLVEEHYIAIERRLGEIRPDCLVVDPVSALLKGASAESAYGTAERLLDLARRRGITTVLTSLTESESPEGEATLSRASTLADTWITLSYVVRGGERNRALSVVKSRGSAHSNQVRELLLSGDGLDLADVYEYGTEVLMGTARLQKESEEAAARRRESAERAQRRHELERRLEQVRAQAEDAESETERLRAELEREQQAGADVERERRAHSDEVQRRRDAEQDPPARDGDDA